MADLATLGLEIDSASAEKAVDRLGTLAVRAEAAASRMETAFKRVERALDALEQSRRGSAR